MQTQNHQMHLGTHSTESTHRKPLNIKLIQWIRCVGTFILRRWALTLPD